MSVKTLTIDGKMISAREEDTIMQAAEEAGIGVPKMCHLEGISDVGACRLCLVEVAGSNKLLPACTTRVQEGMEVKIFSDRLRAYRKQIVELLFAERNHICAACVANGNCELQDAGIRVGMDHVRYDYMFPKLPIDLSHERYGMDHNRCILCTRCVRVCDEIEGAHTIDVLGRGAKSLIVRDMNLAWGDSTTCTSCGKCVMACPTGALFKQGSTVAEMVHERERIAFLKTAREKKQWNVAG
jgi:bidirectional [NiFe] hydrogenase diaphorase subunit